MPGSIIGELILQPILEFILYFLGYYLGRTVIPLVTLGRIKCDRITAATPRRKLKWGGSFHRRGQQIYLTPELTAGIGLILVVLAVAAACLIYYLKA